jgi:ribose 5-phosphate isomerase A
MTDEVQQWKRIAAEEAVKYVQSGMVVGLGVGSTAIFAVRKLAQDLRQGHLHNILGIPCSRQVAEEAQRLGIPLTTLEEHPTIDLTIDGADEVDPNLNLIKGGGGALLREKIVAQASLQEIIVIDETKLSPKLGTKWPVPIEVTPFGWGTQVGFLETLGGVPVLRMLPDEKPYTTDQGNYILDTRFGPLEDPSSLAQILAHRAGIVEHGLFLDLATEVIVGGPSGIRKLRKD